MKTSWQTKKLGEVCGIQTGKWDANHAIENGKYRFYTCAYKHGFCNTKRFSGECLILPGNGVNVGEVFYYQGDFDTYQRTYVINNIKIFPKLLYYHLFCFWKERNLNKQFGSATNFLKIGNFINYEISYPKSLPKQHRIVKILDEVFEKTAKAKENAERNLANAKELFESYLGNVFANSGKDWRERKLGEVCDIIAGQSPEGKYYNKICKGLPFYQGKKEFTEKFIGVPKIWTTKITKEAEKNDILMSVRAPVGPINFATQKICIGRGLAAIRVSKKIDVIFLFYFLKNFEDKIVGNHGAVFNSINKKQIETIQIPLPFLATQKQIVKKLDALSAETKKLETIYKQKLSDLEELKKSVLKKAFEGEL